MKKCLSLFLAIVMLICSSTVFCVNAYAKTAEEYTIISKASDFEKIKKNPNGVFYITKDIDFSSYTLYKSEEDVMGLFKGTIEGNGHTIKNYKGVSIFGYNNYGTIRNIIFEDCDIVDFDYTGVVVCFNLGVIDNIVMNNCNSTLAYNNGQDNWNGDASWREFTFDSGIIRYCVSNNCTEPMLWCNMGTMIGCINNSDIRHEKYDYYPVGGLSSIGGGTFIDCVNNGDIHTGKPTAGGIFGGYGSAHLIRCTNNGSVTSESKIACGMGSGYDVVAKDCVNNGEITGSTAYGIAANGQIETSVNTGKITATGEGKTAFAIKDSDDSIAEEHVVYEDERAPAYVTDSYYLEGTGEGCVGTTPLTAVELTNSSNFNNFNFKKVWQIKDNTPYLQANNAKTIGIAVKKLPKKTTGYQYGTYHEYFYQGDYLDTTGMELVAFDSHGNQFKPEYYHINNYDIWDPGTYRIEVYYDNFSAYFNVKTIVKPGKVTGLKASKIAKTSVTLTWKKSKSAMGYEVQRYYAGRWQSWKHEKNASKNKAVIKKLKKGKSYKFRVVAYRTVKGKKYYGETSKALKVKTKK